MVILLSQTEQQRLRQPFLADFSNITKKFFIPPNMKGFLDPKIEELLADKSDTERLQAIVFSIACLLSGPTPFQPPDFYHIPKRSGKKTPGSNDNIAHI